MLDEKTLQLLARLPTPAEEGSPAGASDEDLVSAEHQLGIRIPAEMAALLRHSNGPCVGAGGLVGVATKRKSQDLVQILRMHPTWLAKQWLPVAGDGFGNFFVLVSSPELNPLPVCFVDSTIADDVLAYVVASNLGSFLRFYLEEALGESRWPFSAAYVLERDPALAKAIVASLPWTGGTQGREGHDG